MSGMIGKNICVVCEEEWIIRGKLSAVNEKSILLTEATTIQKFEKPVSMLEVMKDKIIFVFIDEE